MKADGLVDQVLREMVAFFGRLLRLDLVVVVDQFRVILVRVAAQEAVEALESAAQRPAVVRPGRRHLVARRQVPFADGVGVVAVLQQDLREVAVLEGDHPVAAGITGGALGDAGHAVGVVVAPGHQAGAGGRAERGRVEVAVAQPAGRQRVEVRRADGRAVTAELAEAGVVQHDE